MKRFFTSHNLPYLVFWLAALYFVDLWARTHGIYFIFTHFDKVMHTVAGIALGLFAVMVLDSSGVRLSMVRRILWVVGFALAFGAFWEVKEYLFNNLLGHVRFDTWDTTTDILCDTLGGLISFIYLTYL